LDVQSRERPGMILSTPNPQEHFGQLHLVDRAMGRIARRQEDTMRALELLDRPARRAMVAPPLHREECADRRLPSVRITEGRLVEQRHRRMTLPKRAREEPESVRTLATVFVEDAHVSDSTARRTRLEQIPAERRLQIRIG